MYLSIYFYVYALCCKAAQSVAECLSSSEGEDPYLLDPDPTMSPEEALLMCTENAFRTSHQPHTCVYVYIHQQKANVYMNR